MTQGELEALPIPLQKAFLKVQKAIYEDVVERIRINGFSSATADWQITRLQQLNESNETIQKELQKALAVSDKELKRIFSEVVYEEYYGHEKAYKHFQTEQIPFEENKPLQELISACTVQIQKEYENLAQSMGFAIRNPSGRIVHTPLLEFYRKTLDEAALGIQSGAFSYNAILKKTIRKMTTSGVRIVNYDSGASARVDVAVRRAVLTGFRQVQGEINRQTARDLGTDDYEVTYHIGARPTHQPWQGKVWSYEELVSVCGLGTVTGLHGANCYHDYRPFLKGFSVRTWTDEQLEQMIADENKPRTYNGQEYTTYTALQRQRQLERMMRQSRADISLLQKGDADELDVVTAKAKYHSQRQEYTAFSKAMKLPEQYDRVYQDGLGSIRDK